MLVRHLEGILAGILLALAVCLIASEIFLRNVFSYSLMNVSSIASFLIVWSAFLGASQAVQDNIHVRVDVLAHIVPAKVAWAAEILVMVFCIAFSIALLWSGSVLMFESHLLGERSIGVLNIPMWIPQSVLPLAGCLFIFRFSQRLLVLVTRGSSANAHSTQSGKHHAGHS